MTPVGINDIIIGHDGEVDFTAGVRHSGVSRPYTNDGGDNQILVGNSNALVIGGLGANTITLGNGTDEVVGESGEAQISASGFLQTIFDIALRRGRRRPRAIPAPARTTRSTSATAS